MFRITIDNEEEDNSSRDVLATNVTRSIKHFNFEFKKKSEIQTFSLSSVYESRLISAAPRGLGEGWNHRCALQGSTLLHRRQQLSPAQHMWELSLERIHEDGSRGGFADPRQNQMKGGEG